MEPGSTTKPTPDPGWSDRGGRHVGLLALIGLAAVTPLGPAVFIVKEADPTRISAP